MAPPAVGGKRPFHQQQQHQHQPTHSLPQQPRGLLRKLLSKDVEAETSILLQCIRHVVRHDFFVPPKPAPIEDTMGMGEGEEGGTGGRRTS